MDTVAATIEPALAHVRELLAARIDEPANAQEDLDDVLNDLASVKLCLDIFRPPEYAACDPAEWLKEHASHIRNERCSVLLDAASPCVFDRAQAWACLSSLIHSVELFEDAVLVAELFEEDAVPRIALILDGPGSFPARLLIGGILPIAFETLCERWTVATRGGRLDRTPSGMELRLKGMREPGPSDEGVFRLAEDFSKLHSALRACGWVKEGGSRSDAALQDALDKVDAFLSLLDGDIRIEPADLRRTIDDAVSANAQEAAERSIAIEVFVERPIPPIAVVRRVLVRVWNAILQHAFRLCPRGGRVSFMADYDAPTRRVSIVIEVEGTQCETRDTVYLASVRRGVRDMHGGEAHAAAEKSGMLFTLLLPDRVGQTLDGWLPGWDGFSEQSQQMLRLLKSGGQTPPEDFLLGGILENELERWLMPLLTQPAVVNMVHEGLADVNGISGSSEARLEKVLSQIKRGKPKKEVVRPPYAGELLWAFRAPDQRKALRLDRIGDEALRDLCSSLVHLPVDHLRCLRHIARVVRTG